MSDRRHLIFIVIAVFALIGVVVGVLRPRAVEAANVKDLISQAEAEHRALSDQLVSLQQLEANREQLEADVAKMALALPPNPRLPRFLRMLDKASRISGVNLMQIAPTPPAEYSQVPGSGQMRVSLTVTGNYDRIESFAVQIEKLDRAMKVTSINLAPTTAENGLTSLTATMTLEMFVYHPDGSPWLATPDAPPTTTEEAA